MKKLSVNTLEELQDLMGRILNEIENYSHVSDNLPKSLIGGINTYSDKLTTELNKRYED